MLTLYILNTNELNKSVGVLLNSLIGLYDRYVVVESTEMINEDLKTTDWYSVFYDNEYVSEDLFQAIKSIMGFEFIPYDALIFLKKDGEKMFQSPRMFKKQVTLKPNSLMPDLEYAIFERILDGWIHTG